MNSLRSKWPYAITHKQVKKLRNTGPPSCAIGKRQAPMPKLPPLLEKYKTYADIDRTAQ